MRGMNPSLLAVWLGLLAEVPVLAGGIMVNEPDHGGWARSVERAGLNAVQVTVYARQGRWDSADLTWPRQVPSVESEMRAAKVRGLRVMLVLRVYLEHGLPANRHLWHGMVWPREDALQAWFSRYLQYVKWGAELAERHGVDLLVVGNELNSLSSTVVEGALPDLYGYWLDPARTRAVRGRRAECARRVGKADLTWLDGHRYPDLDSALRAEETVRRDWARRVTGLDTGSGVRPFPAQLAKRRR